ncbi:MAG: hypothetical protein ACRCYQ_06685 [Nocardioides sp.]
MRLSVVRPRSPRRGVRWALAALACTALVGSAAGPVGAAPSGESGSYAGALPALAPGDSCVGSVWQDDVWLTMSHGGSPTFDLRIGAAGVISEFRDRRNAGHTLLMEPSYPGNVTDRVIQETYWSFETTNPAVDGSGPQRYLNLNQAGDEDNNLNPTGKVVIHNDSCSIDVYSIPQRDWNTDQYWNAYLPTVTRYQVFSSGAILVRRVTSVLALTMNGGLRGGVPVTGPQESLTDLTLSTWIPLDPQFKLAAQHFTGGQPDWYYNSDNVDQITTPVQDTFGYTMAYDPATAPSGGAALGVVYGTKRPRCVRASGLGAPCPPGDGRYLITGMAGQPDGKPASLILAPNIVIDREVAMGTIVARDLYLYPTHGLGQGDIDQVSGLGTSVPAPTIYAPGAPLPPEFAPYAEYFKAPLASASTDHLGSVTTFQ